jgi:putative ABC transport system permease protein
MSSTFLGVFGLVALLLAALGIYGLMSFSVAQRQREMGLRMALGADGAEIRRKVVGGGVKLTAVGIVAGVGLAVPAAVAARSVLFGVSALDPVTLVAVVSVFGLVAVVAAAVPAWRASRVDPLEVLRSE